MHHVAFRGCIAIAFGIAALGPIKGQTNNAAPVQKPQQHQQEAKPAVPPIAEKPKTIPEPNNYEPGCSAPKNREDDDLCQQRRMAKAAEEAAWWAKWQTKIGAAGFIAVALSLIFTGWAAFAAARSANAAEKTVVIENRPWIRIDTPQFITGLSINNRGAQAQFMVPIENVGRGPAQKLWVEIGEIDFATSDPPADRDRWIELQLSRYQGGFVEDEVIFPKQPYGHQAIANFSREIIERHPVKNEIVPVFVVGAFYRSAADESIHCTTVGYAISDASKFYGGRSIKMGEKWFASASASEEGAMRQPESLKLVRFTELSKAT